MDIDTIPDVKYTVPQKKKLSDQNEFIAGFGAAFINICLTFPLNKVMFRQMVHGVNTSGAIDQLRKEGLKNLYRGLLPPLMSKTVSVSIMFGSYSTYKTCIENFTSSTGVNNQHKLRQGPSPTSPLRPLAYPQQSNIWTLSAAAFLAGSTEALLCPFERTQMILQSRDLSHNYNNTMRTMVVMSKFGIKEFYRGMSAVLLRNGPSNIIFFSSREYIQAHLSLRHSKWWIINLVNDFVTGAVLGAVISTIFYPINVIRTKMQTVNPGTAFVSIPQAASMVYHERGRSVAKIYYGVSVNCTRALISWGIINASYEVLRNLLFKYNQAPISSSPSLLPSFPSTATLSASQSSDSPPESSAKS